MVLSLFWRKLLEYTSIGGTTFVLDLILLWYLTESGVSYLTATIIAYIFAVTLNYIISRSWVFEGTTRGYGQGYLYFIGIALLGAGVTVAFLYLLVELIKVSPIMGRIVISGFIGMVNFAVNYYFNFRIGHLGKI